MKKIPGPFELYSDYNKLPKGTLIGDYWDVYKINAIAIDSLQSLPFEHQTVRNWYWRETALNNKIFYFINNRNVWQGGFKDTIYQYGFMFKSSGLKYNCNKTSVLSYYKLHPKQLSKFILKASNNYYLSLNPKNSILYANQPNAAMAEVFEFVPTRLGNALKASNGKFVCADFSKDGSLTAKSTTAASWEFFHIISAGKSKIHLMTSIGKFVCADQGRENVLIANQNSPFEWETFILEPK